MREGTEQQLLAVFAKRVREIREAKGLSQEALAFRAGLHRTEPGHLERGERMPRLITAMKLAGALEVSLEDLLGEMRWTPAQATPRGSFGPGGS